MTDPTASEDRGRVDESALRSWDEEPVGWGDEPSGSDTDWDTDRDTDRLLADRPPHHDRD